MAFMKAMISNTKEYFLISDDLEETLECSAHSIPVVTEGYWCRDDGDDLEEGTDLQEAVLQTFREYPNVNSFEIVYRYWGCLSAPGYTDRTHYVLGETQAEVAEQLLDIYFDQDPEYMDDDEKKKKKREVKWLEQIAKGGDS